MSEFVHLHCHSEYSLLDGAIRIADAVASAKAYGCPALALTDHGNLHGALIFYDAAHKAGIKPIIGMEAYVAPKLRTNRDARSPRDAGYHLILLAKDQDGYKNLLKLSTIGHLDGFHYKPRVDKEVLAAYGGGLIALSACLKGEVIQKTLKEGYRAGLEAAQRYAALFPGRFYLELQANDIPEQAVANQKLIEIAAELGLPLVATNDCHYLTRADAEAHDVLLCIQTAACVSDERRMRMSTTDLYFKSPDEMAAAFAHVPEALANTVIVAGEVDLELDLGKHYFPAYRPEPGKTLEEELAELAREGLAERLAKTPGPVDREKYAQRLEYELKVIIDLGFSGYFLIVADFINWAKAQGIPVGPGRGSAAGSLAAYALRITNLDPLPYDLLFERFLNSERVSLPDIDVDFCERRRVEVIRYVTEKYGADCVAQITTFGTMKAKAVIRDVGRAMGMSFAETDRIAKLVPEELKMTIEKALEREPELAAMAQSDPRVAKLLDISRRLEGIARHASTHAAGVVISDKPMTEYVPLYRGKNQEIITQWDMKKVERAGLVKFDFLGLRTMTVIQDALEVIRGMGVEPPDLDNLPLNDPQTYALLSAGDTDGIFQVESEGMRKYLRMLKPNRFEDLVAMNALYRPGPLGSGMVDEFIKRKHGQAQIEHYHPSLAETLGPTYGVIVYQEQVMKIAQVLANYSLGEGDLLRRAMGKKKPEEMAKQRARFLSGAAENSVPEKLANEIFDLMEKFAEYGFNKSHSAAYALVSYHTAYLKAHFPLAYMAALITSEIENQDKVFKYIVSCREKGIAVLAPDVSQSKSYFSVKDNKLVYGLAAIKNVGQEAIGSIVRERDENGPYLSLLDLACRVDLRKVTKRVLEYLIKSGAMDCFGVTRAGMFAALDRVVETAQRRAKDKNSGQFSLMGLMPEKPRTEPGVGLACPEAGVPEWTTQEKTAAEKESLGFYLTSHPLLDYVQDIRRLGLTPLSQVAEMGPGCQVRAAALITQVRETFTKSDPPRKMAICQIEDLSGVRGEALVFPKAFDAAREFLVTDKPLIIEGSTPKRPQTEGEGADKIAKIFVDAVKLLAPALNGGDHPAEIRLQCERQDPEAMAALKETLARHPGNILLHLILAFPDGEVRLRLDDSLRVSPCPEFWREIAELKATFAMQ
ncbi:MAG: DNA polymerase III subunit alpha [Desulfovibrionaceae bacterium]|nr:DNA polymerase III subunit alpha [Desulfovibrionaceae bacterium]MBF0512967.1 DNA polymerase III subunit alpha [Desulfovibrionaceae bacterium]